MSRIINNCSIHTWRAIDACVYRCSNVLYPMRNNFLICRRNILIEIATTLIERSWQSYKTRPRLYVDVSRFAEIFATFSRIPSRQPAPRTAAACRKIFFSEAGIYARVRSLALEITFRAARTFSFPRSFSTCSISAAQEYSRCFSCTREIPCASRRRCEKKVDARGR